MTVVYSAECKASRRANRQGAVLPILVVLFVFSYTILTALVFEQGQTIESQRGLIREMLKDSSQLAALKDKLARDDARHAQEKAAVPTDQPVAPAQKDSSAANSPKMPDKEAKRPGKSARTTKEVPGKPPADLEDVRRSTRVI